MIVFTHLSLRIARQQVSPSRSTKGKRLSTRIRTVKTYLNRVHSNGPLAAFFIMICLLAFPPALHAASDTALASVLQLPTVEELRSQKQEQLASLTETDLSPSSLELANLELETARVALGSLEVELRSLPEKADPQPPGEDTTGKAGLSQAEIDAKRQQLTQAISNQRGRIEVLSQWLGSLRETFARQQAEYSQSEWESEKARLLIQRDNYLERARKQREQLSSPNNSDNIEKSQGLRINILEADENASLISQKIDIKSLQFSVEAIHTRIKALDENQPREQSLAKLRGELDSVNKGLENLEPTIRRKLELLQMYLQSSSLLTNGQQKQISSLVEEYGSQLKTVDAIKETAVSTSAQLMDLKSIADKQRLSSRYSWPDSLSQWQQVFDDIRKVSLSLMSDSYDLVKEVLGKPLALQLKTLLLITLSVGVLTLIRGGMTSHLPELNRSESSYSRWMSALYLHMVRRNLYTLFVVATVPAAMWLLDIPFDRYRPMYWILVVVMVTKPLLNLNHTLFTQRKIGLEWYDRQLYRGLHGSILLGAALIILTLVSRYSAVSSLTNETISRLLMLAMLVGSAVVLWRRTSILTALSVALDTKPKIFFVMKAATLIFPVAGLATGFIGLLGYTNLAWEMARYEGVLLAMVSVWMSVRGFTIDFFKSWYTRSTRKMPNGWIFAQSVVRPLELLVRAFLILFATGATFRLLGWSEDSSVFDRIEDILGMVLFNIGESAITLSSVLVVLASSAVFYWAAKWSREVAYRFLYRKILDHGIRNSLSVFTQYAVVLFGLFALLKILGIDLTALAVLAGAIGVGIGFGLQTIANNFISGILLLIERPFRTGDIINIGGNEGEVTRIGIRSLSVKTWDNTEVIIPNTETMTSAFVNWTHQDNVIRVLEHIGVSYEADPHRVKVLIEEQIAKHPDILKAPESRVLLDTFADSSVNFRVQFFVDISKAPHLKVKSEFLFSVWDAFKAEGIEIPYPQQDLHLRTVSSGVFGNLAELDRSTGQTIDSQKR